ncbi:MAG: hypothetical protein KF726_23120 [Anaerolineae bacterium]|nr:hypothetical protein [Anaerolineae bacterium]
MRQLGCALLIALVLIAGGFLSIMINQNASTGGLPLGIKSQTDNPEANVADVTSGKAVAFFIFAAVALGSVVGFGATLAVIFWLLNRQVTKAHQTPDNGLAFSLNASQPNSIGAALATNPAITIGVLIVVIIAIALGVAIATGAFAR